MIPSGEALTALRTALAIEPLSASTGNLTIARGRASGKPLHVALIESRLASGALGVAECEKLASLFRIVTAQRLPLLLFIDSAGARVSEGLPALGAFRRLYRAALDAALAGAPIGAVCGGNCFGGASMLAALAGARAFCANTRYAMSGPAILAQSAGVSVLDEMFQAMAQAAIGAAARVRLADGNIAFDAATAGELPASIGAAKWHAQLGERLEPMLARARAAAPERIERKDLSKFYPAGYAANLASGVLSGSGEHQAARVRLLGWVDGRPLGALGAWMLAGLAWRELANPPAQLHIWVDCEAHAASLDDERLMLSGYLADLALALGALSRAGTRITTVVSGMLGGGVYVALAAPSQEVVLLYGSQIQLLPGKAIASILGEAGDAQFAIDDYLKAGVAEREVKLGLV